MKSDQFEELCRRFISDKTGLPLDAVLSGRLPGSSRLDLPTNQHQIDLHWETADEFTRYFNIANAKWRSSEKVDQPDVLLLQQVRIKVGAHKAYMITNTGFTAGARAAAMDEGIGLHVVVPSVDPSLLPTGDRSAVQEALAKLEDSSKALYTHHLEYRGLDFRAPPPRGPTETQQVQAPGRQLPPLPAVKRTVGPTETRVTRGPSPQTGPGAGPSQGGGQVPGGGASQGGTGRSPGGGPSKFGGGGGYETR